MNPRKAYLWIVAGLVVWGIVHAIGAYRFNHNVWRGVMVLGASLVFLAFWALMLASRQRRLRRAAAAKAVSETALQPAELSGQPTDLAGGP